MRFKQYSKLDINLQSIILIPLINIVFLLLIFFILTGSVTSSLAINVKLPKTLTSADLKTGNMIITITSENVIYLNSSIVTLKELESKLQLSLVKKKPLLIKSDRRASLGPLVEVWNLCRRLGIERINIATNQEE